MNKEGFTQDMHYIHFLWSSPIDFISLNKTIRNVLSVWKWGHLNCTWWGFWFQALGKGSVWLDHIMLTVPHVKFIIVKTNPPTISGGASLPFGNRVVKHPAAGHPPVPGTVSQPHACHFSPPECFGNTWLNTSNSILCLQSPVSCS